MIAGLLYAIGLISVLGSIAFAGYTAPSLYQNLVAALEAGDRNMLAVVGEVLNALSLAVMPLVGGLVLMGLGRIIMLLSAILRSLRRPI
jgi:hypothetical protein